MSFHWLPVPLRAGQHQYAAISQAMLVIFVNLFLFLLTVSVAPFIFLGVIPIYIFRFIVAKSGPKLNRDLSKILPAASSIFASGNIYHEKPSESIVVHCVFKGQFELKQFQELFLQRVIKLKGTGDGDGDQLQNPELQQFVAQWMGFLFWKWDTQFDVRHHIRMHKGSEGDGSRKLLSVHDLAAFGESLMCQPFAKGRSPWEVILFNNIESESDGEGDAQPNCGLVLHIHHCMLDGYSMLTLLINDLGQNAATETKSLPNTNCTTKDKLLESAHKLTRAPLDIATAAIEQSDELNEFHLPMAKLSFSANAAVSDPISLDKLKRLKSSLQNIQRVRDSRAEVTLYGVLLTAYAEGLRKFLAQNQFKMPKKISVGISLPRPRHPSKLRNHFTSCCVQIPFFDTPTIPILHRLEAIERNIHKQKSSIIPGFVFLLVKLVGCLLPCMIRRTKTVNQATAALSNLPGPQHGVNVADKPLIHFWPTVGMPGNVGIGCVASTYNGSLRLAVRIDESIARGKKLDATKLIEGILAEFQGLEQKCEESTV